MTMPTMHVLGMSTAAPDELEVFPTREDKSIPRSWLRLHGRITVFDQDGSFDTVRIRLRGEIRTWIGPQAAVETLPTSTQLRSNLDFKPVYSASRQNTDEQHLDFNFPIPSANERDKSPASERGLGARSPSAFLGGTLDAFVPSLQISGCTYITQVTALSDRHLVQGSCEVVYWLEAELLRSGSPDRLRKLTCPVDVSSLVMPMEVEASSSSNDLDHIEQVAKQQQGRPISRMFTSQPHTRLSVRMPKRLGILHLDSSSLATGCRRLSIPVTVDVALAPPSHPSQRRQGQEPPQMQTPTLKCSVRAKWFTRKNFTTRPSCVEAVVHSTTLSTQGLVVTLPPLYSNLPVSTPASVSSVSTNSSIYSTSMDLDLLLPQSVASPSVSTELLDISYFMNLSMMFEFDGVSRGSYMANFNLPVTLRPAQPNMMIGRRCVDPLLGYIEENDEELLYAPPSYMP